MQKTSNIIPLFIKKSILFSTLIIKKIQKKINQNFTFFMLCSFKGMPFYHISPCIATEKIQFFLKNIFLISNQAKNTLSKNRYYNFRLMNVLKDTAYPVGRQDRHFYFRLFLLSRKASNATIKLPKDINNANIPMKIEIIS